MYKGIEAYIDAQMRRLKMPGVVLAIVEGGRIAHVRGFGRVRPGGEAPTGQTPFFIGSLTKSFTSVAVMQLVEAGKIELDAPVQRYLPWFRVADPEASAQMTVRHLLNQTSGLPTSAGEIPLADFDDSPGAAERQARALATLVLKRPVGAAFEYSNSNYNLLGLVIEVASGQSYSDYVQEHIVRPLGMSHTYTSPEMAQRAGLAVGYRYWFGFPFAAPDMRTPHGSLAGGMLISSAEDMARWMIVHLNGGRYEEAQIVPETRIEETHQGVAEIEVMGRSLGRYGMGWYADELVGTKLVWHSGTMPHFFAYMALLPEQGKGVVVLFNADHHWMNPVLTEVGLGVTALLAGGQPERGPVPFVGQIPLALRALLLIPAVQAAGIVATLRQLRSLRRNPERRPSGGRAWGLHVGLPLVANLLMAINLIPMRGKRRGYLMLYKPDSSWIVLICGSLAAVWGVVRTGLVVQALRKGRRPTVMPSGTRRHG